MRPAIVDIDGMQRDYLTDLPDEEAIDVHAEIGLAVATPKGKRSQLKQKLRDRVHDVDHAERMERERAQVVERKRRQGAEMERRKQAELRARRERERAPDKLEGEMSAPSFRM